MATTATPPAVPAIDSLIAEAKLYAALSGRLNPRAALPIAAQADATTAATVASALAAVCDTNPDAGGLWLMRSGERRHIIDRLARDGGLSNAVQARRAQPVDDEATDLLSALDGADGFSVAAIETTLANPTTPRTQVERIAAALDRAGPPAPAYATLVSARAALAALDHDARRAGLEARGFFGRVAEKAQLDSWFATPMVEPPVRAAFLTGLPGIGKSALLEEMVSICHDLYNDLTVRLDFDRAGLNVQDVLRLTMEVARQIADRLGDAGKPLIAARLKAAEIAGSDGRYQASDAGRIPQPLAEAIGAAVAAAGRPVLLVLDTLEVLRARGDGHPRRLFEWLDTLVVAGLRPLRVIAAGRGDALDSCADRVGCPVMLAGLDPDAVTAMLDRLDAPLPARTAIAEIANGNPLVLRLATDIARRFGVDELPREKLDQDVAAAYLYRFLLSRIDDKQLCELAHPGLIARRISADFLREVLAPQLKLPPLTPAQATALFDALAAQHWLIEPDEEAGFVRHRSDMRAVLLPLLYRDQPALCAQIDTVAAKWFAKRPGTESQIDAVYHRLQLMRTRPAKPTVSAALAQRFDAATIAELPEVARDVVKEAAGARTSRFRGVSTAASPADDSGIVSELIALIQRQDWVEGQEVVGRIEAAGAIDPRSVAAAAICAFRWRVGQWSAVQRWLRARSEDSNFTALPAQLAVARLEIYAEFAPRRLNALLTLPETPALLDEAQWIAGSLVRQGALGFILAARGMRGSDKSSDADPVAAAVALWTGDPNDGHAALAFRIAREALARRGLDPTVKLRWNDPQLLATLSPYPPVIANLARVQIGHWLLEADAAKGDARLAAAGGLFVPPATGVDPLPSSPFAGLGGLGLGAEWAGATGFVRRNANLRLIGRAAESWRRTVSGDWRYGRPPKDWRTPGPIDATMAHRTQALADADDPTGAARAALKIWTSDGDVDRLLHALRARMRAALRAANAADPIDRARALLARNVPAAFVPSLAIMLPWKE